MNEKTDYLTTRQLTDFLSVSLNTLARWRVEGSGPRYMKAGRTILYSMADVNNWLTSTRRMSTSEAA